MSIPDICITFIVAILGVAYPILLEMVSRLDEKYSSIIVVNLFRKEIKWRLFRGLLVSSLICQLFYAVNNVEIPSLVRSI